MAPGQTGPDHRFDAEAVLTVTAGAITLELAGVRRHLGPGDSAVLAAGVPRRFGCAGGEPARAVLAGVAGLHALLPDGTDRGTPPWIG